jgi:RNA 3'-terminal phosphate cyclase
LLAEYGKISAGFSSLGAKGKPADRVADEAVDSLKDYMESDGCIDPHLADQIVPFMALAKRSSSFTTTQMTEHLLTNLWVIGHFLEVDVKKYGELGKPGGVEFLNK